MKPTWVMTDEEKKEKREKTIKRKQLPPALPKIKLQVHIKQDLKMITSWGLKNAIYRQALY